MAIAIFFTQNYHRLSILLTTLACLLWSASLLRLASTGLAKDDMGYFHTLPATFWAAIVLLTIASTLLWRAPREYKALLSVQLCLFVSTIWLTPLVLGDTLTFTRVGFGLHTLTEYILKHGNLDPVTQWYHNWPGFNIIESAIQELGGIRDAGGLVIWASSLVQFIILLPLYCFLRRAIGQSNHIWAALWFFVMFNWTGQTYFSPQALAFTMLLTLLILLLQSSNRTDNSSSVLVLVLFLLAGLALTHMLTSIAAIFIISSLNLLKRPREWTLPVTASLFTIMWLVYGATRFFDSQLLLFFERALRFDLMWYWNMQGTSLGSTGHLIVTNARVWYTLAAAVIALGGFILSRRIRNLWDGTMLIISVGAAVMVPFQFYGGENFTRTFLFLLPMMAYFGIRLLRSKVMALFMMFFLIAALPFGIISLHGNALAEQVTPSQLAYWHFLESKTERGNLELGGIHMAWTFGEPGSYTARSQELTFYGIKWLQRIAPSGWVLPGMPNYLGFTNYEDAVFRLWVDWPWAVRELTRRANEITEYVLFYNDGEVTSYFHNGVLPQ